MHSVSTPSAPKNPIFSIGAGRGQAGSSSFRRGRAIRRDCFTTHTFPNSASGLFRRFVFIGIQPILRVVVSFFIAGLLVSRAISASITWELNASRWRPAFSSHLLSPTEISANYSMRFQFGASRRFCLAQLTLLLYLPKTAESLNSAPNSCCTFSHPFLTSGHLTRITRPCRSLTRKFLIGI
jgi:hypothetical protein